MYILKQFVLHADSFSHFCKGIKFRATFQWLPFKLKPRQPITAFETSVENQSELSTNSKHKQVTCKKRGKTCNWRKAREKNRLRQITIAFTYSPDWLKFDILFWLASKQSHVCFPISKINQKKES